MFIKLTVLIPDMATRAEMWVAVDKISHLNASVTGGKDTTVVYLDNGSVLDAVESPKKILELITAEDKAWLESHTAYDQEEQRGEWTDGDSGNKPKMIFPVDNR